MTKRPSDRKKLPPCPSCATAADTRTLGGGTYPKYRYACSACGATWQQVPPQRMGHATRVDIRVSTDKRRQLRPYRCSLCLQRKEKGHKAVCPGFVDALQAAPQRYHERDGSGGGASSSSAASTTVGLVTRDDLALEEDDDEDAECIARFSVARTSG